MPRTISITKIGNTTIVKTWNKADQSDLKQFNYNRPADCHEENGVIVVQSDQYPTLIFKPEQYIDVDFTTPQEFLDYAAAQFFFVEQ